MNPKLRATLRLYCEKAEKLRSSRFAQRLREGRPRFEWAADGDQLRIYGASREEVDEFVLTLRFFLQQNEPCSFTRLAKSAEVSTELSPEWQQVFRQARKDYDCFLDAVPAMRVSQAGAPPLTYGRIRDIFIYGEIAHSTQRAEYLSFTEHSAAKGLLTTQFQDVLHASLAVIRDIEKVTRKELNLTEAVRGPT